MIFWILFAILITGIIWIKIDEWSDIASALLVIGTAGMLICLSIFGVRYIGLKSDIAANQEIYKSLTYQLENNLYDNDNDVGKKELYSEIQEWNKDLALYKAYEKDFWIGIFIPNVFDEFELIELEVE